MPLIDGQAYRITTLWSGLAIDVRDSSTDDDAPVVQNPVNAPNPSQHWVARAHLNNQFELVNVNSGKSLSVYYGKTDPGTTLVQYDSHGWNDQLWAVNFLGDTALTPIITALSNSLVIDVPGATVAWDTQLELWPPNGGGSAVAGNQDFIFTPLN